ncbi:lipopolysaccharide biosynthesis protein [Bradyrhizobium genosp. SA-3]|uniref:lipopolysaccharide biosynthesis protein n=1 Tax=Bradyrhizobium genosp. SA-3 TaxID=508868 RepID=UPI00102A9807|nr:lipopolysaccharide biosynthesis protein [Bradyrhizobium genosp. SA-3]RZN12789.1 lipopolysaccharide biosynthesis protein [Bradyrhizobium genosp. SA-3]
MNDLKERAVRGGLARLCGQAASFPLRLASIAILARLLSPNDFGLLAMVTAVTGVYGFFTTAGLSSATVQQDTITDAQISTLFWINIAVGATLFLLCLATAPMLVAFYHEPRLFWVTIVTGAGFLFNAAGVQHYALLQRQLRYVTLTVIETLSQVSAIAVGIAMAIAGFGYWSLVAMALVSPVMNTSCLWLTTAWIPERPGISAGTGNMLRFGGTITLNGLVVYIAYNFEKVLLGRFWGTDALGLYGRAYTLVTIPTDNLNAAVGAVVFSALSRLQQDPARLKKYFLKAYSLYASLTIPITIFCALFSEDIVRVFLGPKWGEAAVIFRLLSPTVLIFGMINPLGWLLFSIGLQRRSLAIALVLAPIVISAYFIGLPYGPGGVAFAYSAAMTLWLIPHIVWCLHGTMISPWDLFMSVGRPLLSGAAAGAAAWVCQLYLAGEELPFLRLLLGGCIMAGTYYSVLLIIMGQRALYFDLFAALRKPASIEGRS